MRRYALGILLAALAFASVTQAQVTLPRTGTLNNAQPITCVNPTTAQLESCAGSGGGGGGAVFGPTAVGSASANPPVQIGGTADGTATGNVGTAKITSDGLVHVSVDSGGGTGGTSSNFGSAFPTPGTAIGLKNGANMVAWTQGSATSANSAPVVIASDQAAVPVKAASAAFASGSIASGAYAAGSIAAGAYVSGSILSGALADGALVTLGLKADAATCATTNTLMACSRQTDTDLKALGTTLLFTDAHAVSTGTPCPTPSTSGCLIADEEAAIAKAAALPIPLSSSGAATAAVGCDTHVFKHITSATDTLAVQGVTAKIIKVCGVKFSFSGSAAQTVFLENTASVNANCSSSNTQIAGAVVGNATTPSSDGFYNALWGGLANTSANGLCINSTGTGGVDVDLWYTQGS